MKPEKKVGRPKAAKEKFRAPGLSVRLNDGEMAEIKGAMKKSGLSQSEWMRRALLTVARKPHVQL